MFNLSSEQVQILQVEIQRLVSENPADNYIQIAKRIDPQLIGRVAIPPAYVRALMEAE